MYTFNLFVIKKNLKKLISQAGLNLVKRKVFIIYITIKAQSQQKMLKINYEVMINIKDFKLMSMRHTNNFQIRFLVYHESDNKKKFIQATPYIILSFEIQNNKQQTNKNSFQRQSDKLINSSNNIAQIDHQRNAFVTKSFAARYIESFVQLDEIVVFKGIIQQKINDLADKILLLNKIYISCELHQISNFSSQIVDNCLGYTMSDTGSVALQIYFPTVNACSNIQITYICTSIELELSKTQHIDSKISKQIVERFIFLYQWMRKYVLHISTLLQEDFLQKYQSQKQVSLIDQQESQITSLSQLIKFYNQNSYELWKRYQSYILYQIDESKQSLSESIQKIQNYKVSHFKNCLDKYHWKNHIIVTEQTQQFQSNKSIPKKQRKENFGENQFQKFKNRNSENWKSQKYLKQQNQDLVFYPFQENSRKIKLSTNDLDKINNNFTLVDKSQQQQMSLIVFVHGYQASSFDMQTLATYLKSKQPSLIYTLISSCNQARTQQPIQESGHRLAIQIKNFLNNKFPYTNYTISFVCHSMGGIIARAALKYLQLYKERFKTFLSLNSPHLGYLYHHSYLIQTSLWVLNQVKKDKSMLELTMQDQPQLQNTFLFQLSKRNQLQWFTYPIFVGCRQDQYVPFWSALVQDKDFFFQTQQAVIYKTLFKNFTNKIQHKIIRLEAIYEDKVKDLSSFVGRTAHIKILNCIQMLQIIYLLLSEAF